MNHDPIRHLKYFRQNLAQNKKPIGFFIAAGCPLSIRVEEDKPLIPDVKGLTKIVSESLKEKAGYNELLIEIEKVGKCKDNIEDILSFLRALKEVSKGAEVRGFTEDTLENIEKDICSKISEVIDVDLPIATTPYHRLVSWINSIDRVMPVEIFTTNYDLLIEKALERNAVPYFDGFVGASEAFFDLRAVEDNLIPQHWTRLWKIHGSINWAKNKTKEVVRVSNPKDAKSTLIYPSHLKYDESRKMPYLALIDKLNRFLKSEPSLLIVSGYSFSDDHLNDCMINALRANPNGNIIVLLYGELKTYEKAIALALNRHNLSLWAFDEAIIGTARGKWAFTNSGNLEEDEIYQHSILTGALKRNDVGGNISYTLQLGNFQILGQYLQSLIGIEEPTPAK